MRVIYLSKVVVVVAHVINGLLYYQYYKFVAGKSLGKTCTIFQCHTMPAVVKRGSIEAGI